MFTGPYVKLYPLDRKFVLLKLMTMVEVNDQLMSDDLLPLQRNDLVTYLI